MKVLHAIDRLQAGGAEKVFLYITRLLADKGMDVGGLLFNTGYALDKEIDKRVKLHLLNRTNKYNFVTLYAVHRICRTYDIVHAHLRHVHAYIRLAQLLFNGKYKLLLHDHTAVSEHVPLRLKGIFRPKYYVAVSEEQEAWAVANGVIQQERAYLLRNIIIPVKKDIRNNPAARHAIKIANIRGFKNIEFSIRLFRSMGWKLDVYGGISEPEYYRQLQELIGNDENIRIIQQVSDFTGVLENYAIAVHSSRTETGPLVLLEYLSAGFPFIAYRTGSAGNAIAEHIPELLMDNYDMDAWKERIEKILADKELPARMKQLFYKQFGEEQYINTCLDIYRRIHS